MTNYFEIPVGDEQEAPHDPGLPPGPYRFEPAETADTYRIYAAGASNPMVEMIYIGGDEDFAAASLGLARLLTAGPILREALIDLLDQIRSIGIPDWHGAEGLSLIQADSAVAEIADVFGCASPSPSAIGAPAFTLLEALEHVRSTLKLRHIDEASDDEVEEALRIADEALAGASE